MVVSPPVVSPRPATHAVLSLSPPWRHCSSLAVSAVLLNYIYPWCNPGVLCAFQNHFPVPCPFPHAASSHRALTAPSVLTLPCHRHCCFPPPAILSGSCGLHWILPPLLWPYLQPVSSLSPTDFTLVLMWIKTGNFSTLLYCGTGDTETHLMALNPRKSFSVLVPKLKHQKHRDLIRPVWNTILNGTSLIKYEETSPEREILAS